MNQEVKKKIGRPLKYKTAQELTEVIDNYFQKIKDEQRIATITGLALELEISREQLLEYQSRPEFTVIIKKAKDKIRAEIEERLVSGKPPIGLIFWLKNNAGWRDEQYQKHEGRIEHGFVALPPLKPKVIEAKDIKTIDTPHN